MSHYFLDSSALAKRYVTESGSAWIRSIFAIPFEHTCLIAQITPVEVYSGAMRRVREGSVDIATASNLRLALLMHTEKQYQVVRLTPQVIWQAQEIIERHPLRAYDAVQLASAIMANNRLRDAGLEPLVFLTSDQRLAHVADQTGLRTEDPLRYS